MGNVFEVDADVRMIAYSKPTISKQDLEHVLECMVEDSIHEGAVAGKFERRLGERLQTKQVVVLDHVSSALSLIFRAADLKEGDEVLLSVASAPEVAEAILFFKAKPVFVDLEEGLPTMGVAALKNRLTRKTKVVICSHALGHAFPLEGLGWGAGEQARPVLVEDCMQSLGTQTRNKKPLGGDGDYAFYSFGQGGMITMGEGAALQVRNKATFADLREVRYAKRKNGDKTLEARLQMGITDLQAAMGLSELLLVEKFLARRREIGQHYEECARRSQCHSLSAAVESYHYNYAHFLLLPQSPVSTVEGLFSRYKVEAKKPFSRLLCDYVGWGSDPRNESSNFPNARNLQNKMLGVPIYPSLSNKNVEHIGKLLSSIH